MSCKDEQIIEIDDTGPVVIEVALRERSAAASIVLGEDERVVKVRRAVAVRIDGQLRKLNTKSANGLFQCSSWRHDNVVRLHIILLVAEASASDKGDLF